MLPETPVLCFKKKETSREWSGPLDTIVSILNPVQDGGKPKSPPLPQTSFSPATSTNEWTSPKKILTFILNPLATLMLNFKVIPSASPKLLNLNQHHPSKVFTLFKSLENWGYGNFSQRKAKVTKLWSDHLIYNTVRVTWQDFVADAMDWNMTS